MRALRHTAAAAVLGLAALASGSAFAGGATVTYIDSDKFADLPFSRIDRERVLEDLTSHFVELGKLLPPGQELKVEVTDLDLAGRIDYGRRSGNDIRIMRGMADWPRMELRYRLEEGGKVLRSGEAKLSDMNYLDNARVVTANEPLRYEKQMLDDWFAKTFEVKVRGARTYRG
ncbi:DUF3016 domain-containing protein [Pseudoduganella sp. UC29_71]|jgi:hypothetical protein|uniref:DUF3016 domain-containing protein n=1 Tax=Pseudoduganella sp. UC29_71 TaxID=3350174 RepID=UPI00366E09EC